MRNKAQEAAELRLKNTIEETRRQNGDKEIYTDKEVANILAKIGGVLFLKKIVLPTVAVVGAIALFAFAVSKK